MKLLSKVKPITLESLFHSKKLPIALSCNLLQTLTLQANQGDILLRYQSSHLSQKLSMKKFIMLCLCPTSLTVLAAGVVSQTINWEKYFQFKKGV